MTIHAISKPKGIRPSGWSVEPAHYALISSARQEVGLVLRKILRERTSVGVLIDKRGWQQEEHQDVQKSPA
jgi:hypothetical protein